MGIFSINMYQKLSQLGSKFFLKDTLITLGPRRNSLTLLDSLQSFKITKYHFKRADGAGVVKASRTGL